MKEIVYRYFDESFKATRLIYKIVKLNEKHSKIQKLFRKYLARKLFYRYHITIGEKCKIGKNLMIPHPQNIIIGFYAEIGDNCKLFQDVTIGMKNTTGGVSQNKYPRLKEGCVICAGAKVLGDIELSENTIVAANSVLLKSTISNGMYAGVPAIMKNTVKK